VYQAGTLSGNPLAVAAGLAALKILKEEDPYGELDRRSRTLCGELSGIFREAGVPVTVNRMGSMFTLFFQAGEVTDFATASRSGTDRFARFFRGMLREGVLLPPSQFEAAFLSTAHDSEILERALEGCRAAVREL